MNLSKSYQDLISCCNHQIVILDGGFGAMVQRSHLTEADFRGKMFADHYVNLTGDNDVLCLTAPGKVKGIHLDYLNAGADLIRTNTFGATSFGQAKYRLEHMAYDIAKAGAQVARDAVKEYNELRSLKGAMITPKFVVGSIGPAGENQDVAFGDLVRAYGEQVRGLLDGGADALLVEGVSDTLNGKAALYAICKECESRGELFPIMVSGVVTGEDCRLQTGQTARAFWHSVSSFPIFSIGFNSCVRDVNDAYVRVSVIADGEIPEESSVNIVGGCSATTPEAIRALARTFAHRDPRKVPARDYDLLLSGLDPMEVEPGCRFVNIAPPGKGGQVIAVNLDGDLEDPKSGMPRLLKDMLKDPALAKSPVMIESLRWDVLLSGMECLQGKGIVNSISLKEGEEVFLTKAEEILRHGFAVVCRAEDEEGLALTCGRREDLIGRMYRLLVGKLNFAPEDILFDPVVIPIGTGRDEHPETIKAFFETCRYVKDNLPHAHVVGDVSLLGYAFREDPILRGAMNSVFLYHATHAGMVFGIGDLQPVPPYADVPPELSRLIEDLLFNCSAGATDALLEYAEACSRNKGKDGSEGGKIFMPRLEKRFVELKQKLSAKRQALESGDRPRPPFQAKILLVSMDSVIHDIDRDILSELLSCYGIPVVDLGCGCSCEKIVEAVLFEQPDMVYLSAQFKAGLSEMRRVVREFKRQEIGTALMVGGDAVSDALASVRIAPEALGPVIYVSDVRKTVKVVEAYMDESKRPAFLAALKAHQGKLRLS